MRAVTSPATRAQEGRDHRYYRSRRLTVDDLFISYRERERMRVEYGLTRVCADYRRGAAKGIHEVCADCATSRYRHDLKRLLIVAAWFGVDPSASAVRDCVVAPHWR